MYPEDSESCTKYFAKVFLYRSCHISGAWDGFRIRVLSLAIFCVILKSGFLYKTLNHLNPSPVFNMAFPLKSMFSSIHCIQEVIFFFVLQYLLCKDLMQHIASNHDIYICGSLRGVDYNVLLVV